MLQNFIFAAISSYGSLVNITITTTRKVRVRCLCLICSFRLLTASACVRQFFSVLFSVFYNKSDLRPAQWSGVALVFAGLSAQLRRGAAPAAYATLR